MEEIEVLATVPELEGQEAFLDEMRAVSPRLVVEQRTSMTYEQTATMVKDVEVLYTHRAPAHLEQANKLRWVQVHTAGVDPVAQNVCAANGIIVTNVAGAHAVPMAEFCLTVMVMLGRGFMQLVRDHQARHRDPEHSPAVELSGRTIGIVGYGQTGREVARQAIAHNMRVLALKRNPDQPRATGYQWPGVGDPEGTLPERMFGPEELHALLEQSDFVIDCLPLTPETDGVFDEAAFQAMRPTAFFLNVGRGETVQDEALARALREDVIAGAGLDVFVTDPEPLPPEHPYWDLDNLFMAPHISGSRRQPLYVPRTNALFCENLRRYVEGEPLLNLFSAERGY
jgi:phosphoglycerate dehydrogenase-like enzyme